MIRKRHLEFDRQNDKTINLLNPFLNNLSIHTLLIYTFTQYYSNMAVRIIQLVMFGFMCLCKGDKRLLMEESLQEQMEQLRTEVY